MDAQTFFKVQNIFTFGIDIMENSFDGKSGEKKRTFKKSMQFMHVFSKKEKTIK